MLEVVYAFLKVWRFEERTEDTGWKLAGTGTVGWFGIVGVDPVGKDVLGTGTLVEMAGVVVGTGTVEEDSVHPFGWCFRTALFLRLKSPGIKEYRHEHTCH